MKQPGTHILHYDGLKATPLSEMTDWGDLYGDSSAKTALTSIDAYEQVPWLFRAVDLRAKAVQKMPLALYRGNRKTDVSETDELAPLVRRIRALLFLTEASLALHGKNYWALETNQFGLNLTPRWVVPTN
ncbi:MAG: hypothetical protein M3Q08_17560, partial [Pseudomonadota bacterium]|nr:hypothetical protein [Pseudomonadota bacterium]